MTNLSPLILIIAFAAVGLMMILAFGGEGDRRFRRRLARARAEMVATGRKDQPSIRRDLRDSHIPAFDSLLKRLLPNPDQLRRSLARTGLALNLGEFVLSCLLVGLIGLVLTGQVFGWPLWTSVAVSIGAGIGLPRLVVGYLGARRIAAFNAIFPEAIDLIVRGLRSGLPVVDSIVTVGRELPDPIGVEFGRIADAVRLGRPLEEALWEVATRLDTPEFRFFIIALAIQRETGGNLAETLANLATLLRRRRQMALKIAALSSEAKASAWIIGSLPFLMFLILAVLSPGYVALLWNDPRGMALLGVGLFFIGFGAAVMAKMVRFEI